jgi:acyl carrier protein
MTNDEILRTFTLILRNLLDDESITLTMETRREDVANWDSFNYVNFIAVAEMQLGVKFRVADVESFEDVGAIVIRTKQLLG